MEKLLTLTNIAERAYGMWLFQRVLPNILIMMGLTIVAAIMFSAMIIVGMVCSFFALINNGFEPNSAMIFIAAIALITTLLLCMCVMAHLKKLRHMPQTLLQEQLASTPKIGSILSFIKGFLAK